MQHHCMSHAHMTVYACTCRDVFGTCVPMRKVTWDVELVLRCSRVHKGTKVNYPCEEKANGHHAAQAMCLYTCHTGYGHLRSAFLVSAHTCLLQIQGQS